MGYIYRKRNQASESRAMLKKHIFLFILLAIFISIISATIKSYTKLTSRKEYLNMLEMETRALKEKTEYMNSKIEASNNPEEVEKIIKETLSVKRESEKVVIILNSEDAEKDKQNQSSKNSSKNISAMVRKIKIGNIKNIKISNIKIKNLFEKKSSNDNIENGKTLQENSNSPGS